MNCVILVGRLTHDPEIRYTQGGKAVANFSIAVDSGFGDNKRADFVPIVVWDKLAEVCGNNISKGRKVLVEGRLQISEYEKDGQKVRKAEVVAKNIEFLDAKKDGQTQQAPPANSKPTTVAGKDFIGEMGTEVFSDEEIPF